MGSEGLNRWRSAGFSPRKKCASTVHVLTAVSRFECGCETASYSPLTRGGRLVTLTFPTGVGARI
jgi:hypothetical protein